MAYRWIGAQRHHVPTQWAECPMSLFLIPAAFLLGSVPSGLIVTWLHLGRDVREFGSGNIGASNVASAAGWQSGTLVAAFDVAKGVAPVLATRLIGGPDTLTA